MNLYGYLLLTLSLFLSQTKCMAQMITLSGVVRDISSKEPIPYVHVWLTGYAYGTSSNNDGVFELKINKAFLNSDHSITFSCIGYDSFEIPLKEIPESGKVPVTLNKSTTELSELVVYSEKFKKKMSGQARRLVYKAISRIPKNYPKNNFTLNTFYRHYCSENGRYVRLIESAIDVNNSDGNLSFVDLPDEKLAFRLTQLRRSFDFKESARIYHPPISLNFLLSNDITSFKYRNPLLEDLSRYNFVIADTTNFGQDEVIIVDFNDEDRAFINEDLRYSGRLYIMQKNYAFIRADIVEEKLKIVVPDSVNSITRKVIIYKEHNEKYFVDRVSSDVSVNHYTKDQSGFITDSLIHNSHIELISNNIVMEKTGIFNDKEPGRYELQKVKYDSTFWQNYTVLKATAIEEKIINDLSSKVSLRDQYRAFNTIDRGGKSILESNEFKNLINEYQGTPLYIILWLDPSQMNFMELKPGAYFKRKIKKKKVKLLMIGLNEDHDDWLNTRKFYGFNQLYTSHKRLSFNFDQKIVQEYFNNAFPYYALIDKYGNVQLDPPPLPNSEDVRSYIKPLIKRRN